MSNIHPLFQNILRRAQIQYDRQEPAEEEQMDEEELDRREEEYQQWVAGLRRDIRLKESNNG